MFDFFENIVSEVCVAVCDTVNSTVDLASDIGSGVFDIVGDTLSGALDLAGDTVEGILNVAGEISSGVGAVVIDTTGSVIDIVSDFLQLLVEDGSEAEAARQALERKIARKSQVLQESFRQYETSFNDNQSKLAGFSSNHAFMARHQALGILHKERCSLVKAIIAGKQRKMVLKARIDQTTQYNQKQQIIQELRCLSRAMQPLYDQLSMTNKSLNSLSCKPSK